MDNFIAIVAFLLAGMGFRRLRVFPEQTGMALNMVVIHACLPALVLLKVPRLDVSAAILVPALMPWAMLAISAAAVVLLSKRRSWDRGTTGCLLLMVPLGNTSFLGIPMVKAFFGDAAIPYALLYDQLGSFLALAVYGTLIVSLYGSGEEGPTVGSVFRKVFTFPPFIALLLAFAFGRAEYPAPIDNVLTLLSSALVPMVMIAVGFQLQPRMGKQQAGLLGLGLGIKMVAAPLLALGICRAAGLDGDAVNVAVFEAGMPPMVSAGAVAIAAGLPPSLTAAFVGVGIAVAFVTLPLLHQLL